MDVVKYYWGILRRASSDTLQLWRIDAASALRGMVLFALGLLIHYMLFGTAAMVEELNVWVSFSILGFAAAICLSWVWNLILSPFRTAKEQKEAWDNDRDVYATKNRRLRDQVSELEAELRPKMRVSFIEKDQRYLRRLAGEGWIAGMCVHSSGGQTVQSVEASITDIQPYKPRILIDNPFGIPLCSKMDVNPHKDEPVNIVRLDSTGILRVCHSLDDIPYSAYSQLPILPAGERPYELKVRVTAKNSGYVEKTFRVWLESDNRLHVVEAPPLLEE